MRSNALVKIVAIVIPVITIFQVQVSFADETTSQSEKYIVRFADDDDVSGEETKLKSQGVKVERSFHGAFKGVIGSFNNLQIAELKRNPKLIYIEKDGPVYATSLLPNPITTVSKSWGLDRINQRNLPLDNQYSYQNDGSSVKAYVIDTGINASHSEFGGRVISGSTQIQDANGFLDCNGHGTHVAGTIGGSTYGVAKSVTLVPVRVLDCTGAGTFSGVIAGIDWVINDHPAGAPAVANLSLGGGYSLAVNDAIARLIADGVSVVVAAGNSNANACNYSPSSAPNAITVGASEKADNRASYSNFGNCLDLFAPGSAIVSSWIGNNTATSTLNGTSMASPHVAGAAALLLDKNPTLTPIQVRDALVAFATSGKVTSAGTGSPNLLLATEIAGAYVAPVLTAPSVPTLTSIKSTNAKSLTIQGSTSSNGGAAIQKFTIKLYVSNSANGTLALNKTITVNTTALNFTNTVTGLTSRAFYAVSISATNSVGTTLDSVISARVQVR